MWRWKITWSRWWRIFNFLYGENEKKSFLKKNKNIVHVPFKFSDLGSEIIFKKGNI